MLYPDNIYEKLGFNEIKELLKSHCLSSMGINLVDGMQFQSNFEILQRYLFQVNEFKFLLEQDKPFPSTQFNDLKQATITGKIPGSYLPEDEFSNLYFGLLTVSQCILYFKEREEKYPYLIQLLGGVETDKTLIRTIETVFDQKGKLKENASRELSNLNADLAKAAIEIRKRIDHIFKNAQKEGWTADSNLTVRDGRLVIPLLAENKRKLKGYVHDESSTGQTLFVEPAEVFELNNKLRDLEFARRREIIKILIALTDSIRPFFPEIVAYHNLLARVDMVRAKAYLAIQLNAALPILVPGQSLDFKEARHPLLFLSHRKDGKEIVPLAINITENQRVVLVSGPNAGGKSVCLKTVGLLQMMLQHGLLIPVRADSQAGIFKNIMIDIGDDQSIESDLSTYSAHLTKMKKFVEFANANTMILIDEFGTGTDPQFGGPMAEAVLEVLHTKHVRGVITTHYSNLKLFANATDGIMNASMLFDADAMQPLYSLQIGKPGSSYAFEIAEKIGLPQNLIQLAKRKAGNNQQRADEMLVTLEKEKKILLDEKLISDKRERKLNFLLDENQKMKDFLEKNKKDLLKEAKSEAKILLQNANKLIENTISEIKSSGADKALTNKKRKELQDELVKLEPEAKLQVVEKEIEINVEVGMFVKVSESGAIGKVLEINKDKVVIAIGELRSVIKKNRLAKAEKDEIPTEMKIASGYQNTAIEQNIQFSPQLDLRGKRGKDAIAILEKYIDNATMMGFSNLRILHGKGDGILRKLIRSYLSPLKSVIKMEDEHADRGGDGITYVYLK